MTFSTFRAAVRQYWKTFVVVAATTLAIGVTALLWMPAKYVSTTQLFVSIQGSTTATAYQNDEVVVGRINSYIPMLTSDAIAQRVIDRLGLSTTAAELATRISAANVPPKSSLIDVAVSAQSPDQARSLAKTVATEFGAYTDGLETPTGEDGQKVTARVVSDATEPDVRWFERYLLMGLAGLGALLLGLVAVWMRAGTDRVIRTAHLASAAAGVPVLGHDTTVPADSAEVYRRIRTMVRSAATTRGCVLEVASVDGHSDATQFALEFGRAVTSAGWRTIVLDANLAELPGQPGAVPLRRFHQDDGDDRGTRGTRRGMDGYPDVLSAAEWAQTSDRVASKATSDLIASLRRQYDQVVVAAPPTASMTTAVQASEYADAVVLLVSPGKTKRADLRRAADELAATDSPLIGTVLFQQGKRTALAPQDQSGAVDAQPLGKPRSVAPANFLGSRAPRLIDTSNRLRRER